ncbi:hypothetical protein L6R52_14970 [Myxococcota bacterium]|nr:hypothetical protein [Myxococcota bacterium]
MYVPGPRELGALTALLTLVACAEPPPELVPCPIGQVYTGSGCLPIPRLGGADAGDAGAPEDAAPALDADVLPDAEPAPIDAGPEPTIDLTGTWARRSRTTHITGDGSAELDRLTVTLLSRVELVQRGAAAEERITTCAVDVAFEGNTAATVTFTDAAISSLPSATTSATIDGTGFGTRFEPQRRILLFGFRSEQDPATSPLPESAQDPRVYDADGDEHPGITLIIGGAAPGELWVASRMIVFEQGIVRSATVIEGTAENDWTLSRLGASNDALAALPIAVRAAPQPSDELRMVRVSTAQDGWDCGRIREAERELFP